METTKMKFLPAVIGWLFRHGLPNGWGEEAKKRNIMSRHAAAASWLE